MPCEEGNLDQLTIKFCLKYWTQQNYQKKGNPWVSSGLSPLILYHIASINRNPKSTLKATESWKLPLFYSNLNVVANVSKGVGDLLAKAPLPPFWCSVCLPLGPLDSNACRVPRATCRDVVPSVGLWVLFSATLAFFSAEISPPVPPVSIRDNASSLCCVDPAYFRRGAEERRVN